MTNITLPLEIDRDLPFYEDFRQALEVSDTLSSELPAERKAKLNLRVKTLACNILQKINELKQQPSSTAQIGELVRQGVFQIEHITGQFFEAKGRTDLAFSSLRDHMDALRGRYEACGGPEVYQSVPMLPRTTRLGKAIHAAMAIPNTLVQPIDFIAEQITGVCNFSATAPVCEAMGDATRDVGHWIGQNTPLPECMASSIVKVENAVVKAGNMVVTALKNEGIPEHETRKTGKNLVKVGLALAPLPLVRKGPSQAKAVSSRRLLPSDLGIDITKGRVSLDGRLTKRGDLVTVRIDNIERLRQGNLGGIPQWLSALKSTARELGATEIEIRGGCVVNPKLLRQLTQRYNGEVTLSWTGNVNVTAKFPLKDTQVASLSLVPADIYADPFKLGLRARGVAERDLPSGVYSYFQQAILYEDRHVWSMRTKASTPSSKIKRLTADLPHFNKFLSSAQVHSFSGSMPGGKSLKANLLYTTVKGKPLYMIKNKIMSAHLIEKSIPQLLVTSKNMSWMERLYLIIQEVKQLNGSQRVYLAWDAKKLPVASLLELERANIAAIGEMSAGSGASPLTVLEVWWPE